jgi:transcriptional regulator with XRE-family HTH domain
MSTKNSPLAQNLKNIRLLAGKLLGMTKKTGEQKPLSVDKFGRLVDRAKSTVSAWESGKRVPKDSEIGIICYVFDVTKELLLHGEIATLGPMALKRTWPPQEEALKEREQKGIDADTDRLIELLRQGKIDKRKIGFWLSDVERDLQLEQLTRKRNASGS